MANSFAIDIVTKILNLEEGYLFLDMDIRRQQNSNEVTITLKAVPKN